MLVNQNFVFIKFSGRKCSDVFGTGWPLQLGYKWVMGRRVLHSQSSNEEEINREREVRHWKRGERRQRSFLCRKKTLSAIKNFWRRHLNVWTDFIDQEKNKNMKQISPKISHCLSRYLPTYNCILVTVKKVVAYFGSRTFQNCMTYFCCNKKS